MHTIFVKSSNLLTPVDRAATEAEYAALAKYAAASGEAPYYIRDANTTTFVSLFLPAR